MFSIIERELPFDDDELEDDDRARVFVGAAPAVVSAGLPGARDEVRAYSARIYAAWRAFFDTDFAPWLADRMAGKDGSKKLGFNVPTPWGVPTWEDPIVVGEVVGGTPAERAYVAKVQGDRAAFVTYRDTIEKFEPVTGPSPSQAWQALILHEAALKDDRAKFQGVTGRALKSADPGDLEDEGGVKHESSIPWGGIITAVTVVGVAIGISSVARVFRG